MNTLWWSTELSNCCVRFPPTWFVFLWTIELKFGFAVDQHLWQLLHLALLMKQLRGHARGKKLAIHPIFFNPIKIGFKLDCQRHRHANLKVSFWILYRFCPIFQNLSNVWFGTTVERPPVQCLFQGRHSFLRFDGRLIAIGQALKNSISK